VGQAKLGTDKDARNRLEPRGTAPAPSAGGARGSRQLLWPFAWSDLQCLLAESIDGWSRHKAPRLGAALAFYTLLSLAPLSLIVVSIVGLVFGPRAAVRDLVEQVRMLAGLPGAKTIQALLEGSRNTTHGVIATAAGLLTLLFGASGVLIELREALNTIWEVPTPDHRGIRKIQHFLKARLFSFALVLAIGFLLIVSLAVSAWIAVLGAVSASVLPAHEAVLHLLNSLLSLLVITLLFAAIYKIMPDVRVAWRDAVVGGAVTSLLFNIGKLLLAIYLGKASFASTYGAAASFVVLIIWVYYSAQIFFFGAEITRTLGTRCDSSRNPDPGALGRDAALGR